MKYDEMLQTRSGTDALRLCCHEDFEVFVDVFFWFHERKRFIFNSHHTDICKALQKVFNGETTNLIINIPPRYSKTELVVKMFSAWCYARNPECNFLHLSYSDPLVVDNSMQIRDIISTPAYRLLFPRSTLSKELTAKAHWKTVAGGEFYATPSGGSVTGFGAGNMHETDSQGRFRFSGAILIDDPLKPDSAYSDVTREFINNRWHSTIKSRRNSPSTTPVIVIMQRIHEHDFTAMLVEDDDNEWTVLNLPALKIVDGKKVALWPRMHDIAALEGMQRSDEYTFSAQYQQRPTPLGGGIIKEGWITYYTTMPTAFDCIIATCDTALKMKTANDSSTMQMWGRSGGFIYLLDQIHGKWETPELLIKMKATLAQWRSQYRLSKLLIEDAPCGTGIIQTLKRELTLPIIPIRRGTDKVTRMMIGAPYFQSGMVLLPEGKPWIKEYVREVLAFSSTMSHSHDDQVDPTLDAIDELLINTKSVTQTQTGGLY